MGERESDGKEVVAVMGEVGGEVEDGHSFSHSSY
jgi:hypothetical protein